MRLDVLLLLSVIQAISLKKAYGRQPSNGDLVLIDQSSSPNNDSVWGLLRIHYGGELLSVCPNSGFNDTAADTACSQLGYREAVNHTIVPSTSSENDEGSGSMFFPVLSVTSCATVQLHILRCDYAINDTCDPSYNIFLNCSGKQEPYKGKVRLSNGRYSSRGLLEIYLNEKWGTVCIEEFTTGVGDVVCRQLGYTNAVRFSKYQPVDNDRIVWLRELKCSNTTNQVCFKDCYRPPTIRNIYCGNVNDVELECEFEPLLRGIGSGNESLCKVEIKKVHIAIIVILILIFCTVFIVYMVLFIGRFVIAAYHKTDRYKIQQPKPFDDYHGKLKRNSEQLSQSVIITNRQPPAVDSPILETNVVIENHEAEEIDKNNDH